MDSLVLLLTLTCAVTAGCSLVLMARAVSGNASRSISDEKNAIDLFGKLAGVSH